MKYKYYSFVNNRSIDDAVKIFKQRLDDAKYIYKKYSKDFVTRECPYCGSDKGEKVDSFHNMYSIDKCRICKTEL